MRSKGERLTKQPTPQPSRPELNVQKNKFFLHKRAVFVSKVEKKKEHCDLTDFFKRRLFGTFSPPQGFTSITWS